MNTLPVISVVMPTYRRPDLLGRCLNAVFLQRFPAHEFEIVVADDADSEETRRQVEELARKVQVPLRYVPVKGNHGPAAARNAGWRAAQADLIAFTDDDCVPDPHWLRNGFRALRDSGAAAVAGKLVMPIPSPPTDYERDSSRLAEAEFVTANCFCTRQALERVGGFDERFRLAWREDSDLQFSLLRHGLPVIRSPEPLVLHPVRPAPWGVSISQQRKAMFNALLYKKHPTLYRERIQAGPPWRYYGILFSLLLSIVGLAGGNLGLARLGFAAWLLLTLLFVAKRLRGTTLALPHLVEMAVTSLVIPFLSIYWRIRGALRFRVFFL